MTKPFERSRESWWETVRGNVTIDWTLRENVRANLRRLVKRTHGYPPDKQEKATRTVLEQAEVLSADWAARVLISGRAPRFKVSWLQ